MEIKDIPKELRENLRKTFDNTREVKQLRAKQQYEISCGRYEEGLSIAKEIENLFNIVLYSYIEKAEAEAQVFDTTTANLPDDDKDAMMADLMVIFLSCDIIDTAIMELNDTLHRTYSDVFITSFNDIKEFSTMTKQKIQYLQESGDYMKDLIFAEKSDNMYEMMLSKAKSILKKRKTADWGKNYDAMMKKNA